MVFTSMQRVPGIFNIIYYNFFVFQKSNECSIVTHMQESFASFWLSRMALVALVVYVYSAIRLWRLAPGILANRLAAVLCLDLAVWALQAALSYAADDPAVTVLLSKAMSWSWPFFAAIAFHLALELSIDWKKINRALQTGLVSAVYATALLFYYLLAGPLLQGAIRRAGYWSVDIAPGLGYSAFSAYYLILNLTSIFLVTRAWHASKAHRERARLALIVVTHAIALVGGFTTDTILEVLSIDFPKVGVLWASVWAVGLNIAMERYGFLAPFSPRDTGLLMDGFVERSMDGIVIGDARGRVIYWNEPLEEMTGIPAEEVIGESLGRLQETLVPDGKPRTSILDAVYHPMRKITDAATKLIEFEIQHRNGQTRWLQTSAFTIPSAEGDILAFIMRDVTRERLATEETLEKLRRQSHAQKMEALGSLAGGIAHDFNNILGGIVGAVSLMEAKSEDASPGLPFDISKELAVISKSVNRAASSVRGLMSFTVNAPQKHEPFRLEESVRRVAELASRTMDRSITIVTSDLPQDALVVGDASRVEQLLLNLVINAGHAMTIMKSSDEARGGAITLSLSRATRDAESNAGQSCSTPESVPYWALTVTDQGVGMDQKTLARAFDPFFTTKDIEQGSGLGLSLVHLVARQHDGFVEAESCPGAGSTFTVYLPAAGCSLDDGQRVS